MVEQSVGVAHSLRSSRKSLDRQRVNCREMCCGTDSLFFIVVLMIVDRQSDLSFAYLAHRQKPYEPEEDLRNGGQNAGLSSQPFSPSSPDGPGGGFPVSPG